MIGKVLRNIFGCSRREKEARKIDEERAKLFNRESSRMRVRVRTAERLIQSLKEDQLHANH